MINQHTKHEMSTITCNEDMKVMPKYVKILILGDFCATLWGT